MNVLFVRIYINNRSPSLQCLWSVVHAQNMGHILKIGKIPHLKNVIFSVVTFVYTSFKICVDIGNKPPV